MNRQNQILLVLLVIQVVLAAFIFYPSSSNPVMSGDTLFGELEVDDIVSMTITDDQENVITLNKDGLDWILADADDFPADGSKITPILTDLVGLKTSRLVTRTDDSHKRLKLADDDFTRKVELKTKDGTSHVIYLGSSPTTGATHVRRGDQTEAYLTADVSSWKVGTTASSWIDALYLSVPSDEVTKITLKNGNGEFVFEKKEIEVESEDEETTDLSNSEWLMVGLSEGESLDQSSVSAILSRVSSVRMTSPLGKTAKATYGIIAPQAALTYEVAGKTYTLLVGAKLGENYVAKSSESDYYVEVSSYTVQSFIDNSLDNFLQKKPEDEG